MCSKIHGLLFRRVLDPIALSETRDTAEPSLASRIAEAEVRSLVREIEDTFQSRHADRLVDAVVL